MSEQMISVEKLTKDYGPIRAVDQISFDIHRGEIIGFLGPNGAGKTTTMKLITGFLQPTLGRILVDGQDVMSHSLATRRKIGYLPENAPLYDDMMVDEFIDFVGQVHNLSHKQFVQRKQQVIESCGISGVLGKDIGTLSKGYRQRVGLAQAILHDPQVLILDEPTSGLDPNQIVEIRELIKELGQEKTVILSTHILPEVQATCNRVMIINRGSIVADDTPQALTDSYGQGILQLEVVDKAEKVLDKQKIAALLRKVDGVLKVEDAPATCDKGLAFRIGRGEQDPRRALFDALVQHDLVPMALQEEQVSLEETFRQLTLND